jgi:hypothetical protein
MNTKCIFLIAFAGVFFAVLVCGNLEQLNHQQPKTSLTLSIMALFPPRFRPGYRARQLSKYSSLL